MSDVFEFLLLMNEKFHEEILPYFYIAQRNAVYLYRFLFRK